MLFEQVLFFSIVFDIPCHARAMSCLSLMRLSSATTWTRFFIARLHAIMPVADDGLSYFSFSDHNFYHFLHSFI